MTEEILYKRVDAAIYQDDGAMNIFCGKLGDLVERACIAKDGRRCFVIVHLECLCADNLEPMYERLDTCVGI